MFRRSKAGQLLQLPAPRFEAVRLYKRPARLHGGPLAQLVEQLTFNQ